MGGMTSSSSGSRPVPGPHESVPAEDTTQQLPAADRGDGDGSTRAERPEAGQGGAAGGPAGPTGTAGPGDTTSTAGTAGTTGTAGGPGGDEQASRESWPVNPAHATGHPAADTQPPPTGGGWVWTGPPAEAPATTATQPVPPPVAPPGYVMVPAGSVPPPAGGTKHSGWRWTGAVVLLLLAALLLGTAVVVRFARSELLDTDRYVATVAPLASDPAVQSAVANRVTNEIMSRVDVPALLQKAAQATNLGDRQAILNLISGPVTSSVTGFVHDRALDFVRSAEFQKLWTTANRQAHTLVSALLTGQGTDVLKTKGNQIILELGPVIAEVKRRLVADGFALAGQIPAVNASFAVYDAKKLPEIQGYVRTLERLAFWLPIVALLLLVGAIMLAPNRRRAALIGFFMTGIMAVLLLIAISAGRRVYTHQLTGKNLDVAAGLAIYDAVAKYLILALRALVVVSVVAVIWLWLAGPGRAGRGVRRLGGRGEDLLAGQLGKIHWGPMERIGAFVARWRTAILIVLGVLVSWWFLAGPTVASAIWLSLLMIVMLILVGAFARLAPKVAVPAR